LIGAALRTGSMLTADDATEVASYHFFAFGLHIAANQEVPGLTAVAVSGEQDVRLWLGSVPPGFRSPNGSSANPVVVDLKPDEASESWVTVWKHEDYFQLRYADQTEFFIDKSGSEVWATWPKGLTLADTATYLLGPIMNIVLRLRGTIALHASAVRIGDVAVAFVGPEGAGKSTTAASFAMAGFSVLTDDTAAIEDGEDSFQIKPAYPRIRLWPNSVKLLFESGEDLPRLTPGWEKRYLQLDNMEHHFQSDAIPLAAIYFLHPRSVEFAAPTIEEEPERDALIKLIGNIGGNYLLGQVDAAKSFDLLQRMTRSVPLRRLVPSSGAASLAQLCDAVVSDLQELQELPS
jgi:hypothetical protein